MSSYDVGKEQVIAWIGKNFRPGETCLDVGACDGKWHTLVGNYLKMDAVEIYEPYIIVYELKDKYEKVFHTDIFDLEYSYYDLILFGDVIEHMTVERAQKVIEYAYPRCRDMMIAVPYQFKQGEMRGNKWEAHIQDDLTHELFMERYPGFKLLYRIPGYAYYTKDTESERYNSYRFRRNNK